MGKYRRETQKSHVKRGGQHPHHPPTFRNRRVRARIKGIFQISSLLSLRTRARRGSAARCRLPLPPARCRPAAQLSRCRSAASLPAHCLGAGVNPCCMAEPAPAAEPAGSTPSPSRPAGSSAPSTRASFLLPTGWGQILPRGVCVTWHRRASSWERPHQPAPTWPAPRWCFPPCLPGHC